MQTDAQKLVVVRDQFALKGLSDDALKQILPAYRESLQRLEFLLRTMPEGNIQRELWLKTQLATIEAQFRPVADRIYQVLPEAQARAFEEGLTNARKYLEAGGIQPEPAAATTTLSSTTIGGQQVSMTGNLPGFNVTNAMDKGFISPSITRQQIVAAARETGFSVLSPGGSKVGLGELLPKWMAAQSDQVAKHLRSGFLVGNSNDEIMREIGPLGPGRKGWAMTEAVVRTSMAEASQAAHDAFYKANEDLLPKTKSGYRWWWDASNDTRLCPVCAPLDGIKFKERGEPPHAWPAHFSCRCRLLPITATMELLEEEDGPASGSFLEATPVEYDRRGKRKDPPPGYTGENAYKRPMKIDGKQQWVRRRDLGPGQTTAGDMLKNTNEHSKKLVLGKHTDAFNKLTGKGGKYEKDPQGAVRQLLGNPLPPGSTPPRPTRGPGPKPVPPAPKAPATPKPKAAPTPAPKASAPALADRVLPAGPQTSLVFGKQGGTGKMFQDSWDQLEAVGGEVGDNAKKMRAFMERQEIVLNLGMKEKLTNPERLAGNQALIKSQQKAADVLQAQKDGPLGAKLAGPRVGAKQLSEQFAAGDVSGLKNVMGSISGAAGYTTQSSGVVNTYMEARATALNAKGMKKVVADAEDALKRMNAYIDFYKPGGYKPGQAPPDRPWIASGRQHGDPEGWITTTIHEVGHQVHFRGIGGRSLGNSFKKLGGEVRVSGYSHENEREQFAEAFVQFVLNPKGLKASHPRLYAWVDDALNEALK